MHSSAQSSTGKTTSMYPPCQHPHIQRCPSFVPAAMESWSCYNNWTHWKPAAAIIPAIILKNCASELCSMLTFIYQQTIEKKCVPRDWKQALVTPIFKKGNRSCPANYRPASLWHQYAARYANTSSSPRPCATWTLTPSWKTSNMDLDAGDHVKRSMTILNRKSQADVAVLDFAKAFDKVPHHRLVRILRHYNFDSNVIGWITSFLSNRTQKVVVDGYESSVAPVLQASHKAPSWAPCSFWSSSMTFQPTCHQQPDYSLMTACYTADYDALQADLNKLVTWSHTWGMEFKVAKCNILTLTNQMKHQVKYRYRMEGEVVKSARSTPYLGVTVNSKLTWSNHIDGITSSTSRLLGFLWRNMHRCNPHPTPKLEYCSSVWDPCRQKHVNQLEMLQRRAARFVMNKPHREKAGHRLSHWYGAPAEMATTSTTKVP